MALEINMAGREILGRPWDMANPFGLFVRKDGFQGWKGIPSRRREALAKAVQHGEHDTRVYLGSRVVTVDGWALARDEVELGELSDHVAGAGGSGNREPLIVSLHGQTTRATGRVMASSCEDSGARGRILKAPLQLQMVCADPRKYGVQNVSPQTGTALEVVAANYGNFPAFSIIEIPSAPAAYTVASPAGVFVVAGATAGGTHRVHLRTGKVTRNGVELKGVGSGPLWAVPAKEAWTHQLSVPGRALTLDTFI